MQSKQSFHTDNEEIVCFYTLERKKSRERTALVLILNDFHCLSPLLLLSRVTWLIRVFAPTSFKGLVEVDIALILAYESILEGVDNTLYMFPFWLSE